MVLTETVVLNKKSILDGSRIPQLMKLLRWLTFEASDLYSGGIWIKTGQAALNLVS
jgi:hypothetical protein